MTYLRQLMKDNIDYIIRKVDAPIASIIAFYANRYPEPTRENLTYPNAQRLWDIRDKFPQYWDMRWRQPLFKAILKLLIVKYEQSPQYRNVCDWIIMMIQESGWKSFNFNRQMLGWKGGKSC